MNTAGISSVSSPLSVVWAGRRSTQPAAPRIETAAAKAPTAEKLAAGAPGLRTAARGASGASNGASGCRARGGCGTDLATSEVGSPRDGAGSRKHHTHKSRGGYTQCPSEGCQCCRADRPTSGARPKPSAGEVLAQNPVPQKATSRRRSCFEEASRGICSMRSSYKKIFEELRYALTSDLIAVLRTKSADRIATHRNRSKDARSHSSVRRAPADKETSEDGHAENSACALHLPTRARKAKRIAPRSTQRTRSKTLETCRTHAHPAK